MERNKSSYSSIESQLFPCTPACACKFHALEVYLHPTFTALSNKRRIWNPAEHLWWRLFAEIVDVFSPLTIFAKELHCGCSTGF